MTGWKRFFLVAGLFNILGGAAGLATLEQPFLAAGMAPPRYPFALQLLLVMVIILGFGYLLVWRDPRRNRGVVWIGAATKAAGLGMSYWALHTGQLPAASWWQPLVVDLPWLLGFSAFLYATRRDVETS